MQFQKNTSIGGSRAIIVSVIVMLNKIDFPSPNKEIEKIILNEKLKIIK